MATRDRSAALSHSLQALWKRRKLATLHRTPVLPQPTKRGKKQRARERGLFPVRAKASDKTAHQQAADRLGRGSMRICKRRNQPPPLEPVAGNGLLARRAFLGR